MATKRLTRARALRAGAGTLLVGAGATAAGALAACSARDGAPAQVTAPPAALLLHTDWLSGPRGQVTEQALAEYRQRRPQVTVQTEALPGDTAEKLTALIAADAIGDVALWTHHLVVYFAKRDFFTDLRPYLKTFKFSMDDVYSVPEIVSWEGKLLAVPFQLNLSDWTYNKTLFRRMGVPPPPDTWTWEQLLATARRLTQPDAEVWGLEWGITTGNPGNWTTPIRGNGGTLLNP